MTRILHYSISPLGPNPEAVKLRKHVVLRYLNLGVSSVVVREIFLTFLPPSLLFKNSTMTPYQEKAALLEKLRLERVRLDEERRVREAIEAEQRASEEKALELELEELRKEEERRLAEERQKAEFDRRAAELSRKKVERSLVAQAEARKKKRETENAEAGSSRLEPSCWHCTDRSLECVRDG